MIKYVQDHDAPQYLVLTECAMGDNIAAANPGKNILRLCMVRCPHMNRITMENVRDALLHDRYIIDVPEPVRSRAYLAVQRMIAIG
jgi:quinolinate synthase